MYQERKADSRRKLKLPELVPGRVVTFGDLSVMAVEHATAHWATTHDYVAKHRVLFQREFAPLCPGVISPPRNEL